MSAAPGLEPRRAALEILEQVRGGRTLETALDGGLGGLREPDRRLAHELVAGVLRQRTKLDQRLGPLVSRGWSRVAPELQDILRLGAYQLTELERVPPHAAVDTSVSLARSARGARAAGFVNAVLRQISRTAGEPPFPDTDPRALAVAYSHPVWLVRRWIEQFGSAGTERLLEWNNTRPRLTVQPARAELDRLAARWRVEGVELKLAAYGAGLVVDRSRPSELSGFERGDFLVQSTAQALLVRYADLESESTIYDSCAAPGGKSIALGRVSGLVVAGDIDTDRSHRLQQNLVRAGSGREHVIVADARHPPLRQVDAALLDAPCLGTGTFARHPEARWRVAPRALAGLVRLQAKLLDGTAQVVRPGGLLVYATCSLEPEENQRQVERFLERHPEFHREASSKVPPELLSPKGDLTVLPQEHGIDGAFGSRLRRKA
jgi:16S rRNA (cytosine967-C5)-methyltransferase